MRFLKCIFEGLVLEGGSGKQHQVAVGVGRQELIEIGRDDVVLVSDADHDDLAGAAGRELIAAGIAVLIDKIIKVDLAEIVERSHIDDDVVTVENVVEILAQGVTERRDGVVFPAEADQCG